MYVIDLEGNEYPLQATTTNNYELNGNQSMSFRILPSKVNKQFIHDITEMWQVVDHDDITHKIIYLKKQGQGSTLSLEVKAIPKIFDDLDSQRIYERYDRHMTANYCFNLIFDGSGYNFVLNGTFEGQQWEGFGEGDTRLTLFKNALNRYKAEFKVVGNTVYIENLIGRDTQFMYRYRLNASNIVQENDANAYYTYAKGYGDYGDGEGGEDWQNAKLIREYTSPIAEIIGIREAPPIKNGNITTVETMDQQLKILVDESLKISVSADIHDLRKQGYALAQPEVGDRVFLIDERIGLDTEVRVIDIELVRDWKGNVIDLKLALGSPNLVKRHQSNLQTAVSNITNLLEGKIKLPFSVLDNAVAEATKALQSAQTELTFSDSGILAIDKNNPNYVTLLNSAGIGVSTDGGATFEQAITGNGINASVIVTGILNADQVAVRGGNESEYTHIQGSTVELKGKYSRTWKGSTTNHDIRTRLHKGHLRFRNDDLDRSLYFSEFGISTYLDGEGEYVNPDGGGSSGSIIWWDKRYSPSDANGLTINSYGGVVALESEQNRIVINSELSTDISSNSSFIYLTPRLKDSGAFWLNKSDNSNDSYLSYGSKSTSSPSVALRFQYGGTPTISVVDRDYTRGGNTTFDVGNIKVNNISKRESDTIVYWNGAGTGTTGGTGASSANTLFATGLRARVGDSDLFLATNDGTVRVTNYAGYNNGNGITYRGIAASGFTEISSRDYKKNIENYTKNALEQVINTPVRYFHLKEDIDDIDPKRIGLIVQESPMDIVEINSGEGISIYAMASMLWKAVQELTQRLEVLDNGQATE